MKHHTPAAACLNLLDELKFYKDFEVGDDNRIQRLFFTDPKPIELAKAHSDILMLDCTYQTNKYGLPLLNIIGASSLHKTTQVGLAFLSGEAEHDFDWVMRALRGLFEEYQIRLPRTIITDRQLALMNALEIRFPESNYLLCRWHFNKCVLAKERTTIHKQVKGKDDKGNETFFDRADTLNFMHRFYHCIDADEVDDFERERDSLMTDYPCMRAYFNKNWWPYKERLARCYTNRYRHFGEQCSSCCEGQHSRIKRWLSSSRHDLFGFLEACLPQFDQLYSQHEYYWEMQAVDQPYEFKQGIFNYTYRIISNWALYKADFRGQVLRFFRLP
jgi:MULE transposase domain